MLNILLTGIGGQGTVLAAKLLAQAAQSKGWEVRTAETIGMAQRGGSVISHVRMGERGERVYEPLLAYRSADLVVAFEPSEALRVLPYLKVGGTLVTATSPVQPVTSALSSEPYHPERMIGYLQQAVPHLIVVDDEDLCRKAGSRKVLNTVLLASALKSGAVPIAIDDLKQAIQEIVKPQFVDMNLAAIKIVEDTPA